MEIAPITCINVTSTETIHCFDHPPGWIKCWNNKPHG
jgi:hypothetical protein